MPDGRQQRLKAAIAMLFEAVRELEDLFPRHFTPDGHLVGSLGEAFAARDFDLELEPASNDGFDARCNDRLIEIKATFGNRSVAFRNKHPTHLLVLQLSTDATYKVLYNGPFSPVRDQIDRRAPTSDWNGQIQITLNLLQTLDATVSQTDRIQKRAAVRT
jgi:hypothetical protein